MTTDPSTQKIGVGTAIIIGMNAMIGAGIFTAPAALASYVGPAGILAYIFAAICVWFIAGALARLAEVFPQEGSFYTYTKQWAGHGGGLIASGLYLLGLTVAMGLLTQAAGDYLHKLIPALTGQTLGLIILAGVVLLNIFGVSLSQLGQQILIITTVFPLIATIIMCFLRANLSNLVPFAPYGLTNVLATTRIVIFSFFGFECATSLFAVVRDPARNVPKALTYSIIAVGAIYTLFVASLILAVPVDQLGRGRLLTDTLRELFPHRAWVVNAIHLSILSAIIGTVHSMVWSSSTLLVSLIKKIKGPASAWTMNQRYAVLIISGAILVSFLYIKNANLLFPLTALCIITAFIMSMITLLTMRSEWQSGHNIKTVLGIGTALIIVYFAIQGIMTELYTH